MKNNFRSYFTRLRPENSDLSFLKDAKISTVWLGLSPKHDDSIFPPSSGQKKKDSLWNMIKNLKKKFNDI